METKLVPLMVKVCAAAPAVAEVGERVVMVGTVLFTVRVKLFVAVPVPFVAVKLMGKLPLVPGAGVPPRMPVRPFIVIPLGNRPLSVNFGAG